MKRHLLYLALLLCLILTSCYEDKGNYTYVELNRTQVTGIDSIYTCNIQEKITIEPQIHSVDKSRTYEYLWMCYDKKDFKRAIDTLSFQRKLDWQVTLPLSSYVLIFAYRDTQTGVTNHVYTNLTVESEFSRGWYVLKEHQANTDLDYFFSGRRNENLLARIQGKSMEGKPRSLGFTDKYTWVDTNTGKQNKGNRCFLLASEKEMRISRILDIKQVGNFQSMFFENSPSVHPQKWYEGSEESGLINNGKLYAYSIRTGEFGISKLEFPKEGDYELSNVMTKNATMYPLLFDLHSHRFCTSIKGRNTISFFENDAQSKYSDSYPEYTPIYAGFLDEGMWEGGKGFIVMRHNSNHSLSIFHIDMKCLIDWDESFLKNRITDIVPVAHTSKLSTASCFGMNRAFQMLYFSVDDKLYYYDLFNKEEHEVLYTGGGSPIPTGESIVLIKHLVLDYQDYMDESIRENVNKLVIATSNGTTYKLYLFETTANRLKDNPEVYKGVGRPSEVIYISPYLSNVFICY